MEGRWAVPRILSVRQPRRRCCPSGPPPGGPAALHKRALWFFASCCILADSPHLQGMSRHTPCFRARWVVDPGRYPVDGGKSLAEPSAPGKAPIFGLPQFPRCPTTHSLGQRNSHEKIPDDADGRAGQLGHALYRQRRSRPDRWRPQHRSPEQHHSTHRAGPAEQRHGQQPATAGCPGQQRPSARLRHGPAGRSGRRPGPQRPGLGLRPG